MAKRLFQFLLVRLKEGTTVAKLNTILLFQFLLVRLKVLQQKRKLHLCNSFQFLLVRLKEHRCRLTETHADISIPTGTIKSETVWMQEAEKWISIPTGTIKSARRWHRLSECKYFNSYWYD